MSGSPKKIMAQAARGGNAIARGKGGRAIGGDAGPSGLAPGGRGGDVDISTPGITAIGGKGGGGGIVPGMPGMDITDALEGMGDYIEGGMGGEAPQPDGRGGRGGLPGGGATLADLLGITRRPHMKLPFWDTGEVYYGRGGDGGDTPQYQARRLIVELLKADLLGAATYFTTDVWYDVDSTPCETLNTRLSELGHQWEVTMANDDYAFYDLPLPA